MMIRLISFFCICSVVTAFGQDAHDMMIGGYGDLVKTDNTNLFLKGQLGGEFNYFATPDVSATAGFEVWTRDEFSFLLGVRWYPGESTFIRVRGLIGANDVSLGGGWFIPLGKNVRFEAIADFYFKVDFAIRGGMVYHFRQKK